MYRDKKGNFEIHFAFIRYQAKKGELDLPVDIVLFFMSVDDDKIFN